MAADLPGDGELRLGSVVLPAGRRVAPDDDEPPVAWVTTQALPEPGPVWAALAELREQTGLVPVLLPHDGDQMSADWFFAEPGDLAEAGRLQAADVLAARWEYKLPDGAEDEMEGGRLSAMHAPFSRQFPGLASAQASSLTPGLRHGALHTLAPARIGLVPAQRPGDVLPVVGWSTFDEFYEPVPVSNATWLAAVLRSWEDRFGATLLSIGPRAEIQLLLDRPPQTTQAALAIAAEHYAAADRSGNPGERDIQSIAKTLVGAPTWTLWWT